MAAAITPEYLNREEVAAMLAASSDTVLWWIKHGVPVCGTQVKLRAIHIGRRWKIRPEWVEEFKAACNPDQSPGPGPAHDPSAHDRATKELRRLLGREA